MVCFVYYLFFVHTQAMLSQLVYFGKVFLVPLTPPRWHQVPVLSEAVPHEGVFCGSDVKSRFIDGLCSFLICRIA